MLYDQGGHLLTAAGNTVSRAADAVPGSEWQVLAAAGGSITLRSTAERGSLTLATEGLAVGSPTSFKLVASSGCTPFPEAGLDATGTPGAAPCPDSSTLTSTSRPTCAPAAA